MEQLESWILIFADRNWGQRRMLDIGVQHHNGATGHHSLLHTERVVIESDSRAIHKRISWVCPLFGHKEKVMEMFSQREDQVKRWHSHRTTQTKWSGSTNQFTSRQITIYFMQVSRLQAKDVESHASLCSSSWYGFKNVQSSMSPIWIDKDITSRIHCEFNKIIKYLGFICIIRISINDCRR
jgi:hypothetical protein